MSTLARAHLILYVAEQARSRAFYERVLGIAPTLDVPGMTELPLPGGAVLGLMPERGITRLLGERVDPARAQGVARCELYLVVDDAATIHRRALDAGAVAISPLSARDWGHDVAYVLDPDGHVLAFAQESGT